MTDATWAIQISPKLPDGTLINIRAENPDQLDALLDYVSGKAADIASAIQTLTAAGNVGQAFAGPGTQTVQQGGWSQPQQQPAPSWSGQGSQQQDQGQPGPAPMCAHGPMNYRTGEKNGKQWKAYFCSSRDRNNQCDAQWLR